MLNYDEALEKARTLKDRINECTEYEKAFVFSHTDDAEYIGGAGHSPVVIWKKNGKITSYPELVIQGSGREIRTFAV